MSQPRLIRPAVFPSLIDKSVFITGGASGIGACMVQRFAEQGAQVAFVDMQADRGEALAASFASLKHKPRFNAVDLRDVAALRSAMRAVAAPIDVLINNAADDTRHALADLTPAYWDDRVAVNLRPMVFAAQEAASQMRGNGGGAIVNIGSISWKLGQAGMIAYITCKAAVHGLTRGLARELGRDNIRVNTISPGWVMTERQLALWLDPAANAEIEKGQCLNVRLQPDDVASMALFLSAEDSRFATSQDFTIDAGWS
jgi:NAD(P)-dependent dehydrogenase (short-subunit alcohol dehydrogenase family)